ncbi:MAG: hypothetical protein IJF32_11080, partial [Oscillospiraceae bacterium]|nr:hypothetical protein [Oscillospiraceae bacterium]
MIFAAGEKVFAVVPFTIPSSASALIASAAHAWLPRSMKRTFPPEVSSSFPVEGGVGVVVLSLSGTAGVVGVVVY